MYLKRRLDQAKPESPQQSSNVRSMLSRVKKEVDEQIGAISEFEVQLLVEKVVMYLRYAKGMTIDQIVLELKFNADPRFWRNKRQVRRILQWNRFDDVTVITKWNFKPHLN